MLKNTLVFGHLALHGAVQNSSSTTYQGTLKYNHFSCFKVILVLITDNLNVKRVFSGHFHSHHDLGNVTYIGAPLQFNFGDSDCIRGIAVYNTDIDQFEFIPNHLANQFVKVRSYIRTF